MRKTSLTLLLIFIIAVLPLGVYADTFESYNVDYLKLCGFGIAQSDDVLSTEDAIVTRAQFVRYAVRASSVDADVLSYNSSLPFGDVDSSHEDYPYIASAVNLGLINGSNGFFLPENPISYYAASKIAIHVLGYELLAESYGGYPYGYIKCANELDIFKDCNVKNKDALTSSEVAKILVNILEADVFETTSIGTGGNEYTPMENLLSRRHKIYKHEGIVTANSYTSLSVPAGHEVSNVISIDNVQYYTSNVDCAYEYLGMSVVAYYKEITSSKRELVCIVPSEENRINSLNSNDIGNVTLTSISYDENSKEKKVKISKSVSVILNGTLTEVTSANIASILRQQTGLVTLIDNNSDGSVDVIFVENYRTVFVGGISKKSWTISDALGGASLVLDPSDTYYDVYIEKNGKKATFEDISINNVISYYESLSPNKKLKKLIISDKSAKGEITSYDSSAKKYAVDKVFYETSDYMSANLDLGMTGVFYLDFLDRIVYCRTDELDIVYGYITGMKKQNTMGDYEVKIFTENDRWVILPVAKKVKYNGTTKTDAELYSVFGGDNFEKQLITYLVSSDRKLKTINTAQVFVKNSEEEKQAINKQTFRLSDTYSSIGFRAEGPSFDDKCYLGNTIIFSIPEENSPDYTYSDDKFEIMSTSDLINSGLYNAKVYDMDEYGNAKACILPYKNKTVASTSSLFIVDHVTEAVNKEGTVVKAIRGFYMGIEAKILVDENISQTHLDNISLLNKGDVIRLSFNKDGYAVAISSQKLIDYANEGDAKKIVGASYDIGSFIAGEVTAVSAQEGRISVDCGYSGERNAIHKLSSLKAVYEFDRAGNTMTTSDISSISVGDYIYMTSRYLAVNTIVVIK